MSNDPRALFGALEDIHRRPAVYEVCDTAALWDDAHVSAQMLAMHLDPESVPASRPHAFIDDSAEWIAARFGLGAGRRVLDLGCGPGLYATRFARAGAAVTGVDLSRRSINHARAQAVQDCLPIEYQLGDYLEVELPGGVDLATLIYCDLCALDPGRRGRLLERVASRLAPGGAVLLDVFSEVAFEGRSESAEHARDLMGGFWAPAGYWGFRDTFVYGAERVVLDKYTIVQPARVRTVHNWLQYYSWSRLVQELEAAGLEVIERYGDVAGRSPAAGDEVMAVIARRAG